VIQLHNAFLSAALERSLLLQTDVVHHTHALLAAAKQLSKVVESCDVQQSGEGRPQGVLGGGVQGGHAKAGRLGGKHAPACKQGSRKAGRQEGITMCATVPWTYHMTCCFPDPLCTALSYPGTSGGGGVSSNSRQRSASQHHLQVLSSFCRQATRQDQLAQLQHKVDTELESLLQGLKAQHDKLSQAPLGPSPGSFKAGGGAGGVGRAWGGVAVGDSSRELASLHNLYERLKMGESSFEQQFGF
jgi:hypothetical protein